MSRNPIDMTHLRAATGGDQDLAISVLQSYVESAHESLTMMEDAHDGEAFRKAAHRLKGASQSIGAVDVAQAAAQAEMSYKTFCSGAEKSLLLGTRTALNDAIGQIERILRSSG